MKKKFLLGVGSAVAILISQTSIATTDKANGDKFLVDDKSARLVMENPGISSLVMIAGHSSHSSHGSHGSHSSHSSGF